MQAAKDAWRTENSTGGEGWVTYSKQGQLSSVNVDPCSPVTDQRKFRARLDKTGVTGSNVCDRSTTPWFTHARPARGSVADIVWPADMVRRS